VIYATSPVDTALMNTLETKLSNVKFQRIDAAVESELVDTSREKTLLDADGKTQAAKIADFIRNALSIDKLEVEAKSLASNKLPALLVISEEMRRMRDYMALSGQSLPFDLTDKRTFVVNTNSPLVTAIYGLQQKQPALAKEMARHLYDLSLLSQKEMEPGQLSDFVKRSSEVLEKLVSLPK
jgi:molecular chaperone HtpG